MKLFTNKDIRNLFLALSIVLGGLVFLLQLFVWRVYGTASLGVLLLSLLVALAVLGFCYFYFRRQNQIMEEAVSQINLYLSGNTDVRIDCDREGSLYKLFHAVNTLATALNAHAVKEQNVKEFLKGAISDISHQLKTPLAALTIYNGLLQDETEDRTAVKELAAKSEKELERIETLVQSLLKITKLDAGAMVLNKAPEHVKELILDIYQHFEFRAHEEQKTIILSGPDDTRLFCDKAWITEAISNLVKNALDHTKPGDRIMLEWNKLPTVTQITIKDNGSGIHPEDIHHIFKRFYRSRFSKDIQGIGLGLPLAKTILEAHDGTITVDSVLGQGSTFVLNFLNLTKL
ncbi:sensor histidine kinase [Paenibacillus sanguinis]|uniref:sensor histidine kinase n=1 Tax=Paenibacillus sanguinis TaxID=225906 RepID=UPI00037A3DFF|nr:HAMP domain-containing sensor histidine kinase [Paenibacillus sanguinis]